MNFNSPENDRSGFRIISQQFDRLLAWFEARRFADANLFLLTGLLAALAVLTARPNYAHFGFGGGKLGSAAMEWKFQHPLSPIPVKELWMQDKNENEAGVMSHLEKRSYRILVPVFGYLFGFGLKTALIIQQVLAGLLLMLVLATLRRILQDNVAALFGAMIFAVTFPGQWGFSDFFCFDGYAYFLIGLAVWTPSPWVLGAAVCAGGLTDERVIMVVPLLWLWHSIRSNQAGGWPTVRQMLRPQANQIALAVGVIAFLSIRIWIALRWGAFFEASDTCNLSIVKKTLHFLPTALLLGLKGGLVIPLLALMLLLARRQLLLLALILCAALPSLAATLLVWDLSRSLFFAFPVLFIAMAVLMRECNRQEYRRILLCALLGSIIFPTCFVYPFKIQLLNY